MGVTPPLQVGTTTDDEYEGISNVSGGQVLVTGAGWALGREQLNSFAFVKEFREVRRCSLACSALVRGACVETCACARACLCVLT
jgi:hypothetical protein